MTRQSNQIQDKKIILVLDTSWLMEIGARKENLLMELLRPPHIEIKIHNRVLRELDGLKNVEAKALQARRAARYLESALRAYKYKIQISDFGIEKPATKFTSAIQSEVDAIVLTLAEKTKLENPSATIVIFTTDRNQRLLAERENIDCEDPFSYDIKASNKHFMRTCIIAGIIICLVCYYLIPLVILALIGLDILLNSKEYKETDRNKIKYWEISYRNKKSYKTKLQERKNRGVLFDMQSPVARFDDYVSDTLEVDIKDDSCSFSSF